MRNLLTRPFYSLLGVSREWLAGVLSGFVDAIKGAFEAIARPIRDAVDRIWSVVSFLLPFGSFSSKL